MVVSRILGFLDILQDAIRRRRETDSSYDFKMAEYNGSMKAETRADVLRDFNCRFHGAVVLFASAKAGGTGLNVHGANHQILCEPQWSPGLDIQIRGRFHRMPQKKKCYRYNVVAKASVIDMYIRESHDVKAAHREDLLYLLKRAPSEPYIIPRLPTRQQLRMV